MLAQNFLSNSIHAFEHIIAARIVSQTRKLISKFSDHLRRGLRDDKKD